MQLKEIYKLIKTLSELSAKGGFLNSINQLRASLTQYKPLKATPTLTPQQQQQINAIRTKIETTRIQSVQSLMEIQSALQDYKLTKTFTKLKIENPFGENLTILLSRISTEMDTNIDSLIAELTQCYQKLNSYQQFLNTINLVVGDMPEKQEPENDELIIFFEGGATVDNLKELSKVSADWNQIVNCFGRLTKENNTDINIVSIERGSLIATLSVSAVIIGGIIKGSDKILDLILKIYEVRKKALELKLMKLDSIGKAIEILEKQSTLNLQNEAKAIAKELMEEYEWVEESELFHETEAATTKAIKKIIKFHNSGGKLDSKIISPTEQQTIISSSLKEKNKQFIKVEEEINNLTEGKQILQIEEGDDKEDDSES